MSDVVLDEHPLQTDMLSVVVPTYMERQSIPELISRIESSLQPLKFEIIIIDDASPDSTAECAKDLNRKYGNIKVVKRAGKTGLGSAVINGFQTARGEVLAVMDADLQHPPELLPEMYGKIKGGYDLVIASRYISGGKADGLSLKRRILSRGAIALAHQLLPRTGNVKDIVSGFFMLKRSVVGGFKMDPVGFKVLLEIVVRGNYGSMIEVPYTFKPRKKGKSNLSSKVMWNYLIHLCKLLKIGFR